MKAKTDWFPPEVKPVYPGVYPTRLLTAPTGLWLLEGWSRWDGKEWAPQYLTMEAAACTRAAPSIMQNRQWRGLAENPEPKVTWLAEEEVHDA